MPTRLKEKAIERSTFVIIVGFYDTRKQPVTPTAAKWSLTDRGRNYINGRHDVDVAELGPEIEIVLSGPDLQILPSGVSRYLTVEGFYEATVGGTLPVNDVCIFEIIDLAKVT